MAAPVISTDPTEVRAYASTAEAELGNISTALSNLVDDCVNVAFWGENGVAFKTRTSTAAAEMSESIWRAMHKFITTVNDANKAIARTLGGDVSIDDVPKPTVKSPAIPNNRSGQGLEPGAMDALQQTVDARRDQISTAAQNHQSALTGKTPNWQGNQKETAVGACRAFTTAVTAAVETGFAAINKYIAEQNAATQAADASV